MKKFNDLIKEQKKDTQLEIGIEIEKEHTDLYNYFKKYLDSFKIKMPISEVEFYKMIAEAHLRELPDYYDRLLKIENK